MRPRKPTFRLCRSTTSLSADGVRGRAFQHLSNPAVEQGFCVSPEIGYRLAGLCDGEGHFGIVRARSAYKCIFVVGLRADDRPFLERMRDEVGLGTVVTYPAYNRAGRNNAPACDWRISAKEDCAELVSILDEYPLWSKKAAEYAVWREAVRHWQTLQFSGRRRIDWTGFAEYHTEIRRLRHLGAARLTVPAVHP